MSSFTSEQRAAAQERLGKHLTSCPVCSHTKFILHGELVFLPQVRGTKIDISTGQPCLSASCANCGHVMLFNILHLGLGPVFGLKAAKEEEKEQEKANG
jgi:hypothetical protein